MAAPKRHSNALNFLREIEKSIRPVPDEIPDGFYSVKEFAEQSGQAVSTLHKKMRAAVKAGAAKRLERRGKDGVKRPYYGPV